MKKSLFLSMMMLVAIAFPLFTACGDDDDPGNSAEDVLDINYTNILGYWEAVSATRYDLKTGEVIEYDSVKHNFALYPDGSFEMGERQYGTFRLAGNELILLFYGTKYGKFDRFIEKLTSREMMLWEILREDEGGDLKFLYKMRRGSY